MNVYRKIGKSLALTLLLFTAGMGYLLAQNVKFCRAEIDLIALQTGIIATRDKLLEDQAEDVATLVSNKQIRKYRWPRFSKDKNDRKQIEDAIAELESDNQRLEEIAIADMERYAEKLTDSLLNDIFNQIELVASSRGCTSVIYSKRMPIGGEEITDQVILQIRWNPMLCRRWHLPLTPQQRAIFFFLPITPRASIFFK
jgi:hypothetical protein